MGMVEIFSLFCVSVWRCVMFQKTMVGIFFLFCVSVWWCGGVVVCHASKGHGRNILLILCVSVVVCHVSKDHGRNILLILCVSVVVWWCGGVSCFKWTW